VARPTLRIGVVELRRRPGTRRDVHVAAPLAGLAVTGARVPEDADLEIDATLESIDGAVTLAGTLRVPWTAECRRCLEDVEGTTTVALHEVFEARPVEGETYPIEGDEVDLEPVVRDAALLNLPLTVLCRPGCAGPSPEDLPVTVEGEEPAAPGAPARDPRWAALDALRLEHD
jgi:uncharacterized protein